MYHQGTPRPKSYHILRTITIVFALIYPVASICSAVAMTLNEGDWWFNLFAVYLGGIVMVTGTLYLSILSLLWEIVRYVGRKGMDACTDAPMTMWLHRLLVGTSILGIATFPLFFLIFFDVLNGGFAILHFACAIVIAVLYLLLFINSVFRLKK